MRREQLETQLTEMWDAVSGITGEDAHEAIEQAYLTEDKMRKQFDDQEKIRDAAPDLLEALEKLSVQVSRACSIGSDPKYFEMFQACQEAQRAIKKARGL